MDSEPLEGAMPPRPPPTVYDPTLQGPAWFITHPSTTKPVPPIRTVKIEDSDVLPQVKHEPVEPAQEPLVSVCCDGFPDDGETLESHESADPLSHAKILVKRDPSPCKTETETDVCNTPPNLTPSSINERFTSFSPVGSRTLPATDVCNMPPTLTASKESSPIKRFSPFSPIDSLTLTATGTDVSLPLQELDCPIRDFPKTTLPCEPTSPARCLLPDPVLSKLLLQPCFVRLERLTVAPSQQKDRIVRVAMRRGKALDPKTRSATRRRVARKEPPTKQRSLPRLKRLVQPSPSASSYEMPDKHSSVSSCKAVKYHGTHNTVESSAPEDTKSLKCISCAQEFKSMERLTKHAMIHASGKAIDISTGSEVDTRALADSKGKIVADAMVESGVNGFKCESCSQVFKRYSNLKQHLLRHGIGYRSSGKKVSYCHFCLKGFKEVALFDVHVCVKNSFKGFKCGLCEKVFKTLKFYKNHLLGHSIIEQDVFSCPVCKREFEKKVSMERHMRGHTNLNHFECETCSKVFKHIGNLKHHILTHLVTKDAEPTVYSCASCSRGFKAKSALKIHMRVHTDVRPFACAKCERRFKSLTELKSHSQVHKRDKPFQCEICSKSFRRKHYMSIHVRTVHNSDVSTSRPYCCPTCGKFLKNPFSLKSHMLVHTVRRKDFACDVCSKRFMGSSTLRIHMTTHGNERPHKCGDCGKGFKAAGDLKKHSFIHSSDKPFLCDMCPKAFKYKLCLTSHMATHDNTKAHHCTVCGKRFKRRVGLNVHRMTHESLKRFFCNLCTRGFNVKSNLIKHISLCAAKPFKCIPCGAAYRCSERLETHLSSHGRAVTKPSFTCDACGKTFGNKGRITQHLLRVHTNERPWICVVCDKAFKTRGNLARHTEIHLQYSKALQGTLQIPKQECSEKPIK